MKSLLVALMLVVYSSIFAQTSDPVKLSKSGICHAPGSTYYAHTKHFTAFKTLDECLKAGGRLPKK